MKTRFTTDAPPLQKMYWPPVRPFSPSNIDRLLMQTAAFDEADAHQRLADLYAYSFGYRDSPLYQQSNSTIEASLIARRLALEDQIFAAPPLSTANAGCNSVDQSSLAESLSNLVRSNPGVSHPFFDYCANAASRDQLQRVAWNEICRNEEVDDEIALMLPGLTNLIKAAVAVNLADEMGHGSLKNQHTYWLRQHLSDYQEIEQFDRYRSTRAWYLKVPSNVFNSLLCRPGYHFAAFGHFLITESWVAPHFNKLIKGFNRVGYTRQMTYFTAHEKLDVLHGDELLQALVHQSPELTSHEVALVEWGAHLAVVAGVYYFDHLLAELKGARPMLLNPLLGYLFNS